ncbi:FAD-binding oxidoreductase [Paenibacillus sp. FSL H8-0457]|uniref:FAD-binding oxidoreductase n=1 Tax=Paenibacillus TaxID=44249 RepID=UPI000178A876|nr:MULTISPECIES: FAD-binding oxidoreductase [unclassified Paenibacillus]ACX65829.1 FAD linked oxidase domain protein [Paenibacillus sp. Y412MC10]ETT67074.1 FAD linked oxidase domain-containing protein [Paenibacillus sp. FSL H8-457]MCM3258296.1 FAD-binding oxidoreductase [Paenibacillus lautus]
MKSQTKLTGRVIFRGDPGYDSARKNWDPHTNKFPKVFVFARKTKDVANAIKWARENRVPIRPRSGRHALETNLSQVNGGIVIDVSEMNKIKLNKKNGTVIVETGNRVGRIANTLARQGFIAPFGDSPTVGIGGITLGGGIGPLQRTIGLISDNLISLEMVDAKGNVIKANKKQNADLLWASRGGGGGNFGIYTKYKFNVRRAPESATVYRITWPWNQFEKVLKAWQLWAPSVDTRLGSELSIGPKKGGNVSMEGLFLGPKTEAIRLLSPLTSVGTPTMKTIRQLPYTEAVNFLLPPDPVLTQKFSNQFSSGFGRRPFPDKAIKYMREFLEKAEANSTAGFFFLNWGGAVSRISPKATAFFWRKAKFYVEWNTSWIQPSDAAKNIALTRNTRRKLQPYIVGSYINVPDQGIKNSGPVYYGTNYPRLRKVKAKYDPENVFNNPQSIPPAR